MQSPIVQPQSGDPTNGYLHVMSVYYLMNLLQM